MSEHTPMPAEWLVALADAYLLGELDAAQLAELEHELKRSPASRALFATVIDQATAMREVYGNVTEQLVEVTDAETDDFNSILSALDAPENQALAPVDFTAELARREKQAKTKARQERRQVQGPPAVTGVHRPVVIPKSAVVLAIAAMIALVASVYWLNAPGSAPPKEPRFTDDSQTPDASSHDDEPVYIASVTAARDATWADGQAVDLHTPIYNRPLELASGIVELEMTNGVVLTIEGPARLIPDTQMRVALERGRLVSRVPDTAHGFTVRANDIDIIDLGTEFAVGVFADGSEVHILEGAVRVAPVEGIGTATFQPIVAGTDTALSIREGHPPQEIVARPDRFYRYVPSGYERMVREAGPLCYWRFSDINSRGRIEGLGASGAVVLGATPSQLSRDTPFPEHPGERSLYLDHQRNTLVTTDAPAETLAGNFTLEAWVWVPAETDRRMRIIANNIAEAGPSTLRGLGFGVSGDPNDHRQGGPVLMFTGYNSFDAFTTAAIPTDRWVHVAATVDGWGALRLYIDGTHQPHWMHDSVGAGGTILTGQARLRIGGVFDLPEDRSGEYWTGGIDELAVYGRALDEHVIRQHASQGGRRDH